MATSSIYQLKITLNRSKPPIWRRVLVPDGTLLPDLHKIIQVTMGWDNAHLHQFIQGQTFYGAPDEYDDFPVKDYRKVPVREMLNQEKDALMYEYDFGDSWEHTVLLEKILPPEAGQAYPVCLAGKRACPPEDCGGVWGYEHLLEVLADPKHEEHEDMMEWMGGDFDPEEFDLEEVNTILQKMKFRFT